MQCARPKWRSWDRTGIPPEANLGGCYAIYGGKHNLIYVGLALTERKLRGSGQKKYGLLNRLQRHVLESSPSGGGFIPKDKPQWKSMTDIRLIAFKDVHRYLAAALEAYLIRELKPTLNRETQWELRTMNGSIQS